MLAALSASKATGCRLVGVLGVRPMSTGKQILDLYLERNKEGREKKLSDEVDWSEYTRDLDSVQAKHAYQDFRTALRRVESATEAAPRPEDIPKIDWADWKKRIRFPGIVEEMQKTYEGIEWPEAEIDASTKAQTQAQFDELLKYAKDSEDEAKREIVRLDKLLAEVEQERKELPNLTVHDMLKKHPEWKAELDKNHEEHKMPF